MRKDIVKNAVVCLSHLKIEDITFEIARDIVIEEYEQQKEEIEKLKKENNILREALLFIWKDYKKDTIDIDELEKALKELKAINKQIKELGWNNE